MPTLTQPLSGTFIADKTHSTFSFTVKHMLVANYTAYFDDVDLSVVAEEGSVGLTGSVAAESISIKFPPEFREHVLNGAEFLDARNHPSITFSAGDVAVQEDGKATINGELTIKGITNPFSASGTFQEPAEDPWGSLRVGVDFAAVVDRRDWDLTWQAPLPKGGDVLAWEVRIDAHVELIKQAQ
ncbi:MAG: YceI family protein [Actinomycetota bacterium]